MDKFALTLSPEARRDLDRLDDRVVRRILGALPVLEDNPFPGGKLIKKIKGKASAFYRLRVGEYRVFYSIEGPAIAILKVIGKKGEAIFTKR